MLTTDSSQGNMTGISVASSGSALIGVLLLAPKTEEKRIQGLNKRVREMARVKIVSGL